MSLNLAPTAQQSHEVAQVVPKRKLLKAGLVAAPVTMVQFEVGPAWAEGTEMPKTTTVATSSALEASAAMAPRPPRRVRKRCMRVHRHDPGHS